MRLTKLAVVVAGCLGFLACSDSTGVSPVAPPQALRFTVGGPTCNVPSDYATIQAAIGVLGCSTIKVASGTYTEVGQIVIDRDLTIVGAGKNSTIIKPFQDTGDPNSGDLRGWFLAQTGITFNMSRVTLDGAGKSICHGIYDYALGTIQDINVKNIGCAQYYGRAIYLKNNATVRNVTFQNIERIGVFVWQGATAAIIDGITYVGKGPGDHLDYGIELGNGGVASITNSTISNNTGEAYDGSTSAGILVTTFNGPGTQATIARNTLTNNTDGIHVGYENPIPDASVVVAHLNNISGNLSYGVFSTFPEVDAECNWWGAINGPGPVGSGDNVSDHVDYTPWIPNSLCGSSATTRKPCEQAFDQQKRDFEADQAADKKTFENGQRADKVVFNSTPHTDAERKAFDDDQRADKNAFEATQKADKATFTAQNKAGKLQCSA